jgi:hypothetical protein
MALRSAAAVAGLEVVVGSSMWHCRDGSSRFQLAMSRCASIATDTAIDFDQHRNGECNHPVDVRHCDEVGIDVLQAKLLRVRIVVKQAENHV